MPFASEEEKFQYFDSLGPDGRAARLAGFKDPIKAVALNDAYNKWAKFRNTSDSDFRGGLIGAAQGATMGFGDEIGGGIQAGLGAMLPESMGGYPASDKRSFKDRYRQERDDFRQSNQLAKEAHPKSYAAGEIAGSFAPMAVTGVNPVANIAGGGISGAGYSEADLLNGDWSGIANDSIPQAALAAILTPAGARAGRSVQAGVQHAGDVMAESAGFRAGKAMQPGLAKAGVLGEGRITEMGRWGLNENAVRPFDSAEGIARKVQPLKEKGGSRIAKVKGDLNTQLYAQDPSGLPVDDLADRLVKHNRAEFPAADATDLHSMADAAVVKLESKYANQPMDFVSLGDDTSFNYRRGYETQEGLPTLRAEGNQELGRARAKYRDDMAEVISPELAKELKAANKYYSNAAPAHDMGGKALARAVNKQVLSATDIAAAITGGLIGGEKGAGILAALNHGMKPRWNSMSANTLNVLAKFAGGAGPEGVLAKAMLRNPERLGKALPVLMQAAGREEDFIAAATELASGF